MCGIAGFVGKGDLSLLHAMAEKIVHRGPDAQGAWHSEKREHGAGLAHTRLSILDLSDAGAQPMHLDDLHLVYNGEIYNAPRLRDELVAIGCYFRGHSDTEVLLHGYRVWGDDVIDRLEGMFAFAIWDDRRKRLLLARDRIGIKPLYYAAHEHGFLFASGIGAVLAHGSVEKRANREMIESYLALGYVPSPHTMFESVRMLPPAHKLVLEGGKITISRYWQASTETQNEAEISEASAIDALDERLNRSVADHLLADVEVGAFLSGGVDSSLVAAIASRHLEQPLKTFTIGFEGGGDERGYARLASGHIGSEHHEHLATPELFNELPLLLRHMEQPLFDNSMLPTFLVSQHARKEVKVVLSGDGGDEPFLGYEWTRRAMSLPRLLPNLPFPGWRWAYRDGFSGKFQRLLFDTSHDADARYLRRITASSEFCRWLLEPGLAGDQRMAPTTAIRAALSSANGANRFALADLENYLPEDVLFKVDRMSMAHGLEVRVPLLDHHLVEFTMHLPDSLRFKQGRGKYLLRKVAERYLPEALLVPRKQGFTVPVSQWLRGQLGERVEEIFCSDTFASRGVIRPQKALELLAMHRSGAFDLGHRIWSIVILEMWFQVWMDE